MTQDTDTMTPERVERREKIKQLTAHGNDLYAQLQANAHERDRLILAEMREPGVVAKDVAALAGLTVARIYKLRDNALAREKE